MSSFNEAAAVMPRKISALGEEQKLVEKLQ